MAHPIPALVLTAFFDVASGVAPLFIIPLALGNFLGIAEPLSKKSITSS